MSGRSAAIGAAASSAANGSINGGGAMPVASGVSAPHINKKPKKFKPTAGTHQQKATSDQHDLENGDNEEEEEDEEEEDNTTVKAAPSTITDVNALTSLEKPHPHQPVLVQPHLTRWRSASYGAVGYLAESPDPDFALSELNIYRVTCCGATLAELPKSHLTRLMQLAVPSAIGGVLSVCMNIVNLAFLGHLSPELLGGAALGNAYMLITGYTVMLGLCSSIDTLASQAYGAGQSKLVGLIAQRAAVAYTLVIIPILFLWYHTEAFFLFAGQDPLISKLAGEYVWYCIPSIFFILYGEVIKRYLQAQSIITPGVYIAIIANVVHATAAYTLTLYFGLELQGASLALCLGFFTIFALWVIYLRFINRRVFRRTCPHLSWEIFHGWGALFRLGVSGMMMLLFEWMSFELCAIGAGWMGDVQLDTMIVFSNICTFLTMAPSGLAISTSTLVGHALGGGRDAHARMYAHAAGYIITAWATLELFVLVSVHSFLGNIFTTDPVVIDAFGNISICVALFVMFDCYQTVESGVLRGLGLQFFGATMNLIAYYVIGLPLGFFLCFYIGLGVPGLALGLLSSVFLQTFVFLWKLSSIDWHEEMIKTSKRIESEKPDESIIDAAANVFGDGYRTDSDADDEIEERAEERESRGFIHAR